MEIPTHRRDRPLYVKGFEALHDDVDDLPFPLDRAVGDEEM